MHCFVRDSKIYECILRPDTLDHCFSKDLFQQKYYVQIPYDLEIGYLLNLVNIFQLNVTFIKVQNMFVK